jgi:alpha-L-rhamnosidase
LNSSLSNVTVPYGWPDGCRRLWHGDGKRTGGAQVALFRRTFDLAEEPDGPAVLTMFAEGRFVGWLNGQKIARGPWLHVPSRRVVTQTAVGHALQKGRNALALLAWHPAPASSSMIVSGEPGPVAALRIGRDLLVSDCRWRMCRDGGFVPDSPVRGWAVGNAEWFRLDRYPEGWTRADFDDGAWDAAEEFEPTAIPGVEWIAPDLPELRFEEQDLSRCSIFRCPAHSPPWTADRASTDPPPLIAWARHVEEETWAPLGDADRMPLRWTARPGEGRVLLFDLGREIAGHVGLEFDSASPGEIEILHSERLLNGKPDILLKNTVYADRLTARAGRQSRPFIGYSAFRYVALVWRGFEGPVRVRRVIVEESFLDVGLRERTAPAASPELVRIWDLCRRTLHCSFQDGATDCPSREQNVYVGDSAVTVEWLQGQTGDARLLRHTVAELFLEEQGGAIRDNLYGSWSRSFVDFNLLAVRMLARAAERLKDRRFVESLLPRARRVVDRVQSMQNGEGLIDVDWSRMNSGVDHPPPVWRGRPFPVTHLWLFLDHPGMGWHNLSDTPIDRSGLNTAVHALLVVALRSLADLERFAGRPADAEAREAAGAALAGRLAERFWDRDRRCFPDGIRPSGLPLDLAGDATNTLCLLAGAAPPGEERALAVRTARGELPGARNGPFMAGFLLEVLVRLGEANEARTLIETAWGPMAAPDGGCAWETFAGDRLDSLCHPWSAAPLHFLPLLRGS